MKAFLFACLLALPAAAQTALSPETIDAYRKGTGMGMAMPAEMNGYPGPRHILDLGEKLQLTADQRSHIQALYEAMHADAVRLGSEIIEREEKLERGFAEKTMTAEALDSLTSQIAERQGRLRFVHLRAHLAAKEVLTAEQVSEYVKLRHH